MQGPQLPPEGMPVAQGPQLPEESIEEPQADLPKEEKSTKKHTDSEGSNDEASESSEKPVVDSVTADATSSSQNDNQMEANYSHYEYYNKKYEYRDTETEGPVPKKHRLTKKASPLEDEDFVDKQLEMSLDWKRVSSPLSRFSRCLDIKKHNLKMKHT